MEPIDLFFAEKLGAQNEDEQAFLAALMEASRSGHLCLNISYQNERIQAGAATYSSPYIHRYKDLVYLKRNWVYETRILEHLFRLLSNLDRIDYHSSELNSEQQSAVSTALSHSLSIITGGPGTGKTFIVRHLIKAILQAKGSSARIFLTAPTGKAVSRLQDLNPKAECSTLHALLGIRSERDLIKEGSYLQADLIVLDESSMVDVRLLAFFLASVRLGTRIVLIGDSQQLPPVESGSLFADLVDLIPTSHLSKSLRSDRKEILELSESIQQGRWQGPLFSNLDLQQEVKNRSWDDFRILSCVKEGPWGVNTLNAQLFASAPQDMPIPIIITRTDYAAQLYNGETGVLLKDKAVFIDKEGNQRFIALASLPAYEYAYCLSVHKSQGSEFNDVLVLIPPGSEVFGREILYTAVTRAKQSVKVFGKEETILKTLQHISKKESGLRQRFKERE
jgi:exodeoxyribonuclease V alpha subunit